MANGFGNLWHDVLNYVQHPPLQTHNNNNTGQQIACRFCSRSFISTQALITHIDSHMENEEVAIRRLYSSQHINSQRQFAPTSHCFPPGFPVPIDPQNMITDHQHGRVFQLAPPPQQPMRRNPFFSAGQVGSSQQPVRQMQPVPPHVNLPSGTGLLAQFPTPQVHHHQYWKPEEESSNDGTKAYILQLEKPIKKIDFIDLVNIDDDNSDVPTLDLALKL